MTGPAATGRRPVRRNADVLQELVPLAGSRVIDVGCGNGGLVRLLTKRGARATGLECQASQLARARAAAPVGDEDYVEGVAEAMPFSDRTADVVVFFHSLHHVPPAEMDTALGEAARVLRAGGLLYVSEPVAEGAFFELARPVDDETEVRRLAYEALGRATAHGLEPDGEHHFLHPIAFESYEAFADMLVSADGGRALLVEALEDELRQAFVAAARRTDDGFAFELPTRVNLLRKRA
ncbi:MAG: methyltransferase domain-containing protein [Actinobacteria bacterium]|nr:methyltransferase domain-containing protein [Actinomycetota bacterium]